MLSQILDGYIFLDGADTLGREVAAAFSSAVSAATVRWALSLQVAGAATGLQCSLAAEDAGASCQGNDC